MKQTAVEWLESEMLKPNLSMKDILEQAKEMEKQNMINFLKSVFRQDGFDYEESYNNFLKNK